MALPFTKIKFALLVENIPTEFSCTLENFLPFLHTALIGEPLSSDYIHVHTHVHLMMLYCMDENLSHLNISLMQRYM